MMNFRKPTDAFASTAVLISAAIWGLYWVPLRYLESVGVAEAWTVVLINLPAAAIISIAFFAQLRIHRPHLTRAVAIGILMGFTVAFFTMGLVYSSVIRVTLLFYLTPIWSTLIGMYWLNEPTTKSRWLAICMGLLGLTLLISQGGGQIPLNIGDAYGFTAGITWAVGGSMVKRYDKVPMNSLLFFQLLFAALAALFLDLISGRSPTPSLSLLVEVVPISIAISLLIILPCMLIIFWAQKFLYPGRVGLLMMSEVMVATLTASLFLPNEVMGFIEWLGAVFIIGACFVEIIASPSPD